MSDTTVKKVQSSTSPTGSEGQTFLASGKHIAMRMWKNEEPNKNKPSSKHDYETVGFVLEGRAELHLEGQVITLEPGDSWLVPANAEHTYVILENFSAIEATSPPAHAHDHGH